MHWRIHVRPKTQLIKEYKFYKGKIYLWQNAILFLYLFNIDLKQNNLDQCQNKINTLIQVN